MIAAVILAAGSGRRMGGPKALLRIDNETLLQRAATAALDAGCKPVLAIIGDWDPELGDLEVQRLVNPLAAEGMASSIRRGVAALPEEAEAALIMTVDQPAVDVELLKQLLALAAADPGRPVACAYAETMGIPALFPRRWFPALLELHGDRGAKAVLLGANAALLPFPGGERDLDTPEDLKQIRR